MSAQKRKGTAFESLIVAGLQQHLGDGVCRRATSGAKDRGDVHGVYAHGQRLVLECKNHRSMDLAGWVDEAEVERGNDDALAGLVVHKRRGTTDPLEQYVTCTVRDVLALVTGQRVPS